MMRPLTTLFVLFLVADQIWGADSTIVEALFFLWVSASLIMLIHRIWPRYR